MNGTKVDETTRDVYKVFKDPVHGTIKVHPLLVKIIDTPQFQRLRNVKQMGGKYFVYPGASHNRFEHSIGVSYLAGEFVESLKSNQSELDITKQDVLCVQIAGMCHDLGHGPFSHVFDSKVAPRLGVNDWKHEDASVMMFEYMLRQSDQLREEFEKYELKISEEDDIDLVFIKELILGCPVGMQHDEEMDPTKYEFKGRPKEKLFLFEIVSNKFTGIDVDKWDYTARDCHGLGLSYDFDWKQYISFCRVLDDKDLRRKTICAQDKEVTSLYDMFHAREMLHRRALQQEICVSIELMLTDALVEACYYLKKVNKMDVSKSMIQASNLWESPSMDEAMAVYEQLNDTILQTVLLLERNGQHRVSRISEVWQRLQQRQLYQLVGKRKMNKKINAQEMRDYIIKNGEDLQWPRDFEVIVATYDYGMKDRDPLQLLKVHSRDKNEAQKLTQEEKSNMLPQSFEESHIRLYCKKTDPRIVQKLKRLFDEWDWPESPSTPSKYVFPSPPENRRANKPQLLEHV